MTIFFHPFIDPADGWSLVNGRAFGDPDGTGSLNMITLLSNPDQSKSAIYAVMRGKLTLYSPISPPLPYIRSEDGELIDLAAQPTAGESDTVALYLIPRFVGANAIIESAFEESLRSSQYYHRENRSTEPQFAINYLRYFVYSNVSLLSVRQALCPDIDELQNKPDLTKSEQDKLNRAHSRWDTFLRKGIEVGKTASKIKKPIGRAAQAQSGSGTQIGFGIVTKQGPFDPGYFHSKIATVSLPDPVVKNQTKDLATLLGEDRWPLIKDDPQSNILYPYTALLDYKNTEDISYAAWREVGDQQKKLYQQRLRQKARPNAANPSIPQFVYNMHDLFNLFQLEAVAEFYINFDNPWHMEDVPPETIAEDKQINLLPLYGAKASMGGGNTVLLDDELSESNLKLIAPGLDVITLYEDTGRPSRQYRILNVNYANATLELDARPDIGTESAWKISHRPSLVLIDAFGYRARGAEAAVTGAQQIELTGLDIEQFSELSKVNKKFDTISLKLPNTQRQDFRIEKVVSTDTPKVWLKLDKELLDILPASGVKWSIDRQRHKYKRYKHYKLEGSKATADIDPTIIVLQDIKSSYLTERLPSVIRRVRRGLKEKIRLTIDGHRQTFRIVEVIGSDQGRVGLELDKAPQLTAEPVAWQIPAGVGGAAGWVKRPTKDKSTRGWDHYDGLLFPVINGTVVDTIPWSSYSERRGKTRSSIRGNKRYHLNSYLSTKHTFALMVTDEASYLTGTNAQQQSDKKVYKLDYAPTTPQLIGKGNASFYTYNQTETLAEKYYVKQSAINTTEQTITISGEVNPSAPHTAWRMRLYDGVHDAYHYASFNNNLPTDICPPDEIPPFGKKDLGKGLIRMHIGYRNNNGSFGCLVSPYYYYLRNILVAHHLKEYNFFYDKERRKYIKKHMQDRQDHPPRAETFRNTFRSLRSREKLLNWFANMDKRLDQFIADLANYKNISKMLIKTEAKNLKKRVSELKKLFEDLYNTRESQEGDEPDTEVWGAFASLAQESLAYSESTWKGNDDQSRLMRELSRIDEGIKQRAREIYRIVKVVQDLRKEFGWDDIIFGELFLIRPDERDISQDKSNE